MSLQQWFGLDGRQALVTGASRGLGRSMALALARAGADVIITGRTPETLEATAEEIRALGRKAGVLAADMKDATGTAAACETILAEHGAVDILVNNIGNRSTSAPVEDQTIADWEEMMAFNLSPTFAATQVVGRQMIARGQGGRIINISSIAAMRVIRGIGGRHYETAKAAVLQFTRCVAADWGKHGITCNAICPGLFMTDANLKWERTRPEVIDAMVAGIPAGRAGRPEEIGPLAVFLASPAAGFVTGAAYVIDGGAVT